MTKKNLYNGQPGTSSAAVYTAGENQRTTIFSAVACNPTGTARTLDVWFVDDGDSAVDANKVYDALSVPANDSVGLQFLINMTTDKAGTIHMAASAATAVTVHLSGDVA